MIENSQPGGGYLLLHDGLTIPFLVERSDRKHLAITVHPELRLEVDAPLHARADAVLDRVEKRAKWIAKQWRYFQDHQPRQPARRFVTGESHRYLGRQYRLKVETGIPAAVRLVARWFEIRCAEPGDPERVRELLQAWYRTRAKAVFPDRLAECVRSCSSLNLAEPPPLTIRKMTHRWGSCTVEGRLVLNLDLIQAPTTCIDYVITHELCHLKVRDHNRAFYALLTRVMPDWEARKSRLERLSS